MPELMEFHEKHPELRDQYEIITIHGMGAKDYKELAPHLAKLESEVWKKPLPFPILFDADGKVVASWGIRAYPTIILLDREGRILHGGSLDKLKELLKKE